MSAVLLNALPDLKWATSPEMLATPCEHWPQSTPPEKKKRKSNGELRYELARRYHSSNLAAARIILRQPILYPGLMTEWALLIQSNTQRRSQVEDSNL